MANGDVAAGAVIAGGRPGRAVPLFRLFYRIDGLKSGMHHPQGMLWIRHAGAARHVEHREPVALERIAPTLCAMFSVPPAPLMRAAPLDVASGAGAVARRRGAA